MKMDLVSFTSKFFENLGCKVSLEGEVLKVENVPESFEKTYQKGPYYIVFEKKNLDGKKVLMKQGEELFNLITNSLKKTASTTLLKINFNINPRRILEDNFSFKNCSISEIRQSHETNFFYRFIFQTNFIYLNKQEQTINGIYIHNGKIVKGDLEGYPIEEGKKEEVSTKEIAKNYEIAKNRLKELVKIKTEQISEKLDKKLSKEIERIEKYYETQAKEAEDKIENEKHRMRQTKENLYKSNKTDSLEKMKRNEKNIEKIRSEFGAEKLSKEKLTAINDEKQKHSLNIDNNLLNTTVVYYPVFTFNVTFDKNMKKNLAFNYNPLTEELGIIKCSSCQKQIKHIDLCANGHVVCDNCLGKCGNCKEDFCIKCLNEKCSYCNCKICSKCKTLCKKCHKIICKNHAKQDSLTGEPGCVLCLKECPRCRRTTDPKSFKKDSRGMLVCRLCIAKEVGNKVMKDIFR
jgi:hypothetical protein